MAEKSSAEKILHINGIDAETGEYAFPSMDGEKLTALLYDKDDKEKLAEAKPENFNELQAKKKQKEIESFGVIEGVKPENLEEAGWGIIFANDADPAIREALEPLIQWRDKTTSGLYQVYDGKQRGHRSGENKNNFLKRVGNKGPGPVDPKKVPYYLLIVGDPDRIPYRFQTQLDVQYAVGRIHFETVQEYANYAQSVIKAESGEVKLPRTASFFGVANKDDMATQLSSKYLVEPIHDKLKAAYKDWEFSALMREQAMWGQLDALLGGDQTPSFLFSASHGMSFRNGSDEQFPHQGALLCQDWTGPKNWKGAIDRSHYFSSEDLTDDRNLLGMIAFFFACYGGGTPKLDEFAKQAFKERAAIAPRNFVARLPAKMLSLPRGGALAVVGHVERAWGYSFVWPDAGAQTEVFESTFQSLLNGNPIGLAMEYFNERYAELSTMLADEVERIEFEEPYDPYEVAGMWTANNDARGYALLGDPAVRLPVAKVGEESTARPVIEVKPVPAAPAESPSEPATEPAATEPAATEPAATKPVATKPAATTTQAARSTIADGAAGKPFDPLHVPEDLDPELKKKLQAAWVAHVEQGYANNDQVFQRILNTFLSSYRFTVIMYWILFLLGVGFFAAGIILALVNESMVPAAVFGGLGAVTFIGYFIGRSVQSIEENLEFITWLGIIYNSYWTRLAWTFDENEALQVLEDGTKETIGQLEHMINRHAEARGKRKSLENNKDGEGS